MAYPLCVSIQIETVMPLSVHGHNAHISLKKKLLFKGNMRYKNTFSLLSTLYSSFHQLSATFCTWFHSPWLLHCHLDSLKLHFLEKFTSSTSLPTYVLSNRKLFFHKLFCFVFHFSTMFRDCQSLIWKKSKQTKKASK